MEGWGRDPRLAAVFPVTLTGGLLVFLDLESDEQKPHDLFPPSFLFPSFSLRDSR